MMDRTIWDQAIDDMSADQFDQFRALYEKAAAPLREIRLNHMAVHIPTIIVGEHGDVRRKNEPWFDRVMAECDDVEAGIRELVCKSMSIDPTPYAIEARVTASEARVLLHRMDRYKPVAAQPPQ